MKLRLVPLEGKTARGAIAIIVICSMAFFVSLLDSSAIRSVWRRAQVPGALPTACCGFNNCGCIAENVTMEDCLTMGGYSLQSGFDCGACTPIGVGDCTYCEASFAPVCGGFCPGGQRCLPGFGCDASDPTLCAEYCECSPIDPGSSSSVQSSSVSSSSFRSSSSSQTSCAPTGGGCPSGFSCTLSLQSDCTCAAMTCSDPDDCCFETGGSCDAGLCGVGSCVRQVPCGFPSSDSSSSSTVSSGFSSTSSILPSSSSAGGVASSSSLGISSSSALPSSSSAASSSVTSNQSSSSTQSSSASSVSSSRSSHALSSTSSLSSSASSGQSLSSSIPIQSSTGPVPSSYSSSISIQSSTGTSSRSSSRSSSSSSSAGTSMRSSSSSSVHCDACTLGGGCALCGGAGEVCAVLTDGGTFGGGGYECFNLPGNHPEFTICDCGGSFSSASSSVPVCPGDLCSGPYDPNGDDVCASYDLICEELSEPPCARCVETSASSSSTSSIAPRCGDGFLDPGEECDDGNPRNGDYCSVLCRWEGLERCANNIIEPPEQCDDGNTRDGDGCSRFCRTEQILGGPLCGDGLLDAGEECDDGNTGSGDGCDAWCRWEGLNRCGNSIIEWGEQCDDGNLFNSDGCSTLCQWEQTAPLSSCGDGRRAKTEQCDDGNSADGDGCDRGCRIESFSVAAAALLCGDGLSDVGEEGDDGNLSNGDGCSSHCLFEQGRCGDSTVQRALGEQCEPSLHNASLPYGCTSTCRFLHRECGNGIPNLGEECDSGPLNSNLPDAPCRPDCSLPHCGDIVLDPVEFCDDGNLLRGDGCDEYCRRESDLFPQYSSTSSLPSLRPAASLTRTSDQAHPPLFATLQTFEPWRRGSTVRVPTHAPAGETGPAAMAVMAAGAAAGLAWMRRRRKT